MIVYDPTGSRGATLSDDRKYRYALWRRWSSASPMVFVMCNPSTADSYEDDPTIRKCIGFSKHHGMGGICVVNLYALRATDPRELQNYDNPVGPHNYDALTAAIKLADGHSLALVAAWGAVARDHGPFYERQVRILLGMAASRNVPFYALRIAKDGRTPCHPLMLPYASVPMPWAWPPIH